jgi:hypothetical protein
MLWLGAIILGCGIQYIREGYGKNRWDIDYSLVIPITMAVLFAWFFGVPKDLEFSDTHFIIRRRFGRTVTLPWSDLKYWGSWNYTPTFMIQFGDSRRFGVLNSAYSKAEWSKLIGFLSANFPDRQASGFIGARMFRWKNR